MGPVSLIWEIPANMKSFAGLLAILFVVVLTACGGDSNEATESDGEPAAKARFVAISWHDGTIPVDWLTIRFSAGDSLQTVQGSQLRVDEDYVQPHSQWFPTDTTGTLTVDFTLASPSQGPLSEGRVELELRNDWRWEVQFHLAEDDPTARCFGCVGAERFPLVSDDTRSLWVVWGGNSISNPVVY